jgi:uncharacterized protein (TIGR02598 family)
VRKPSSQLGFSLAESLIAISILSFTLLTIIGFMPAGLDNLKKAEDRAAKARIVSSLVAELEAKPWPELEQARGRYSPQIYYDRVGLVAGNRLDWAYVVRFRLQTSNGLPGAGAVPPDLLTVEVEISDRPLAAAPFADLTLNGGNAFDVKVAHVVNTESRLGRIQNLVPTVP